MKEACTQRAYKEAVQSSDRIFPKLLRPRLLWGGSKVGTGAGVPLAEDLPKKNFQFADPQVAADICHQRNLVLRPLGAHLPFIFSALLSL